MGKIPAPEPFFTNDELELLKRVALDAWQCGSGIQQRACRLLEKKIRVILKSRQAREEGNR